MHTELGLLQQLVDESENIVFFGGAGVSTESGIPDFRSVDGLYSQSYRYPPERILSHSFYNSNREEFFEFYKDKILRYDVKPNPAHLCLAQLEKAGKLKAVITQNIDGLHQMAGSENVLELHGSIHRNLCQSCGAQYGIAHMRAASALPRCSCGGHVKPDVVLYEEALEPAVMQSATRAISRADVLIIGGTSLVVYPAAGLVEYYRGEKLVLINKDSTHKSAQAKLVIAAPIGQVLAQLRV